MYHDPPPVTDRWLLRLILGLIVVWAAVNLATLLWYPAAQCDEGYYGSVAVTFWHEGHFGTTLLGEAHPFRQNWVGLGRLYLAPLALVFRVLGVGLWQMRFWNGIGWLALIALTYLAGRALHGPRVGGWAALLVAFSPAILLRARFGRPEVWLAVAIVAQVLLYTSLVKRPTALKAVGLGLLASASLDIHLNAVFFALALGLVVVADLGLRRHDGRSVAWFALGGVLGVVYVLAARLLPHPAEAIRHYGAFLSVFDTAPGSGGLAALLAAQWQWFVQNFVLANRGLAALETIAAVVGLVIALRRRTSGDWLLAALFVIPGLLYTLQAAKSWYHTMPWLPLGALLAAGALPWLEQRLPRRLPSEWLLAPLALLYLAGSRWLIVSHRQYAYVGETEALDALVGPAEGIMAESSWYYGFHDRRFIADWYLDWYMALNNIADPAPADIDAALRGIGVDTIILDGRLHCKASRGPTVEALEAYAQQACTLEGTVPMPFHEPPSESRVYTCAELAP